MSIDLVAIKGREKAATKGPWAWHGWPAGDPIKKTFSQKDSGRKVFTAEMSNADATFVVYARSDIPALITELKRHRELAKVVKGLQQAKEEYNHWYDSKTPQERVPEAEKECRLRAIMAQKERDVIDAATELLKEAQDAQEG